MRFWLVILSLKREEGSQIVQADSAKRRPLSKTLAEDTMIVSYSFGKITIDGQEYTEDVIIMPSGEVVSPWWRKAGHELALSDIKEILETTPSVLVVGTGDPGMMKPISGLGANLQAKGIRVIVQPTKQAVDTFNALREESEVVAACFHLTC